jgi:glycopeptide antibiotics resistance protein
MKIYLPPIESAFIAFPILAFLITIPFVIYNYKKYGSIPFIRVLIFYSFILYLLTIYFLAILPLPSMESVSNIVGSKMQLIPFKFVDDFNNHVNYYNVHSYISSIYNPIIREILLNIVMFIPFGIYMRYYFKLDLKKTIIFTFIFSLFLELTQLTGLYFIYPRNYRVFDVDDLITNTLGGLSGYLLTPYLTKLIPSRDKIDKISYERGANVRFLRRILAFLIDLIVISIIFIITLLFSKNIVFCYLISVLVSGFVIMFTNGYSLGKWLVSIKLVSNSKIYIIIRHLLLYLLFIPLPLYIAYLIANTNNIFFLVLIIFLIILYLIYIYSVLECLLEGKPIIYEIISNTEIVSTIKKTGKVGKIYIYIEDTKPNKKDIKKLISSLNKLIDKDILFRLDFTFISTESLIIQEKLLSDFRYYLKNSNINIDNFLYKIIVESSNIEEEIIKDIEINNYDIVYIINKNNHIKDNNIINLKCNKLNLNEITKTLNNYIKK